MESETHCPDSISNSALSQTAVWPSAGPVFTAQCLAKSPGFPELPIQMLRVEKKRTQGHGISPGQGGGKGGVRSSPIPDCSLGGQCEPGKVQQRHARAGFPLIPAVPFSGAFPV